MSLIFVNTNNCDPKDKLYSAARAGKAVAAAEGKMQAAVKKVIARAKGFTTIKGEKAKGYTIRLEVARIDVIGRETKCSLAGAIVRYPATTTADGSRAETMVSTGWTGSARATGTSEQALLDCVEAVAESMVETSIASMRTDFTRW